MKRIDDILDNLKEVDVTPYDEDAMTDLIMSRIDEIEQKPAEPKVIHMAPRWMVILRNVSSAAAIAILCLMAWNFTEGTTSTSDSTHSTYTYGLSEASNMTPGNIYANYLQRKASRKTNLKQLISQYYGNN